MKLKEIVTEGISNIVYHAVAPHVAVKILDDNVFKLTPTIAISAEENISKGKNKEFFLSTTRSRSSGGYHIDNVVGVLFTLNGEKLSNNFKGIATEYYDDEMRRGGSASATEMEDRVFSGKPYIKPAIKYIRQVDVLFDLSRRDPTESIARNAFNAYAAAKRRGLPAYFYSSREAFLSDNKRKALTTEEIKKFFVEPPPGYNPRGMRRLSEIKILHLLLVKDTSFYSKLPSKVRSFMSYNIRRPIPQDLQVIKAEFHNNARKQNEDLYQIIMEMKKRNLRSIEDLLKYLHEKWKDVYE